MLEQQLEQAVSQNEKIIDLLEIIATNTSGKAPKKKAAPKKTKGVLQAEEVAAVQEDLLTVGTPPAPTAVQPQSQMVVNTPLPVSELPKPAPAPAPLAAEPQMTDVDIQGELAILVQTPRGEEVARAILGKYGATNLRDMPQEHVNAIYAEMKAAACGQ